MYIYINTSIDATWTYMGQHSTFHPNNKYMFTNLWQKLERLARFELHGRTRKSKI